MTTLRSLDPRVTPIARQFLRDLAARGMKPVVTSARRDPAKQAKLYACFQRVGCSDCSMRPGQKGCYPAAPPGQSTHAVGAAFDIHLDSPADYAAAGSMWEQRGFTWGGRFGDRIHFDVRPHRA
ncbi:MAG TPA: D-alanyl-D-alanine carboxypeptidase family protein [Verrucomicrobiae bacterium]|nr:D-alanyl-D-alanine carboxypeptidase family protein [Verrucomicrobiae bacterium]